ncbi:Ldh family oxidoreductase [Streptomyces sp. G45]|uniref:Ldh family oxidoreductase n=1 Tax=Streptomyces sp. G45 TaxID=3406627 RepID=UPI003C2060F4
METYLEVRQHHDLARDLLTAAGLPGADADAAADVVGYADRHGYPTHGLKALVNMYVPWLRGGRVDPAARPRLIARNGAVSVLDGADGLGVVVMTRATDLAADTARRLGVGVVAVRRSSHFGAAGFYTHRLAHGGLAGIAMTNCGAQGVIPPLGGARRLLGTNPLSASVPADDRPPFVLDMSTTVVATGRVKAALQAGEDVPEGWLIGPDGSDVTDPAAYFRAEADVPWLGGRLATGGAKGYGLGLLVDLLCGPFAGAAFGPRRAALTETEPAADRDVGHLVIALSPAAFGDPDTILGETGELLGTVSACPPAAYARDVTYPGAPEAARAAAAERKGIPLSPDVAEAVASLARELGVPVPGELCPAEGGADGGEEREAVDGTAAGAADGTVRR